MGCSQPPAERPVAAAELAGPSVVPRPLSSYVPSVGLRWLVQLRPKALMAHPRFSKDWEPVFAADRLQAFVQASGADPKLIEEAWIAGYDLGELFVFDGREVGDHAERAFEARSLTSGEVESDYDNLRHLTGMIDQTPHAFVHIKDHVVALAVGDIRLARIVRAYAEGKLKKTPPALGDRFLSPHAAFHDRALVRGFLRGPYENATDAVAAGFVTGVAAIELKEDLLLIHAQALGAWPEDDLDFRLTKYADQLLSTRELRALGWGFPTTAPVVECEQAEAVLAQCSSKGVWSSSAVASALHRITSGSMAEIVGDEPPGWHPEATTVPPKTEQDPGDLPSDPVED